MRCLLASRKAVPRTMLLAETAVDGEIAGVGLLNACVRILTGFEFINSKQLLLFKHIILPMRPCLPRSLALLLATPRAYLSLRSRTPTHACRGPPVSE